MKRILAVLALTLAACTPPAEAPKAEAPAAEAPAPAVDMGPYTNSWDAAEFSRFRHELHAATPGAHQLTLQATTDSSGGETVAVYPVGADGQRITQRIVFVIADTDGNGQNAELDFPADGSGVPVEVVIENAGGRRHAGNYTLTIAP
jgi:hypothetical protein